MKKLGLILWRWEVKFRNRGRELLPDPNKLYWIDPHVIELICVMQNYDKYADRGMVKGGNWDQNTKLFNDLDVNKALEARFLKGAEWEETAFYNRVLAEMANGEVKWGCESRSDFDKRLQKLERLVEKIKVQGYMSQDKLSQSEDVSFPGEDEITVRIDRYGRPLFEDGRHRLAIAKLLDLDRVSIKVTVRHKDWYDFVREVKAYAKTNNDRVYQPLTHFDLNDIPSLHGPERFELINNYLPIKGGDLLDIGAHWGYFCHRFEDLGYNCYAVESDIESIYFMEKLKLAKNKKFKVVASSIFDYQDKKDFDVVLALNIFHHFLKNQEQYDALIEFLQRIQTKAMFFQPHQPNSPQMQGAYKDFQPAEFVDFVKRFSGLNVAEYIGAAHDKRPIYFLRRE